jgi:hypothetical protein
MASVMVARSEAGSLRNLSSKLAKAAARADSSRARPVSVIVSVIRRRSLGSVRRLSNPRTTSPSTSIDIVGSDNPMWSPTSDSDAPSFLYTKANDRYCGTDISLAPYLRSSARITRKTKGTTSSTSRAHSPTEDRTVLVSILLCQTNGSKHEVFILIVQELKRNLTPSPMVLVHVLQRLRRKLRGMFKPTSAVCDVSEIRRILTRLD